MLRNCMQHGQNLFLMLSTFIDNSVIKPKSILSARKTNDQTVSKSNNSVEKTSKNSSNLKKKRIQTIMCSPKKSSSNNLDEKSCYIEEFQANIKNNDFTRDRHLLKKFRNTSILEKSNNLIFAHESTKSTDGLVLGDPGIIENITNIDSISMVYSYIVINNLAPSLVMEIYFIFQLLTSVSYRGNVLESNLPLHTLPDCIYFACQTIWNMRRVFSLLDRSTLRLLAENHRLQFYIPSCSQYFLEIIVVKETFPSPKLPPRSPIKVCYV